MRLGIFGGSFDPVHRGHLKLAACCADQAELDRVWFVPTAQQPLKPSGSHASDADRLAMLQMALKEQPRFEVSDIELKRGGISYTADTLASVRQQEPAAELFFLMGADSLADLPKWRQPEQICQLATLLVVRRAESPEPDFQGLSELMSPENLRRTRSLQVEMAEIPISSSQIRQLIAEGGLWQTMVPDAVADYIESNHVYDEI